MGNILQEQGKREEALACYHKTLSLKPDHADAYNNMGVTLRDQGKGRRGDFSLQQSDCHQT